MAGKFFTDTEIDEILSAVESSLEEATSLAKSEDSTKNLKKEEGKEVFDEESDAPVLEESPEAAPEAPVSEEVAPAPAEESMAPTEESFEAAPEEEAAPQMAPEEDPMAEEPMGDEMGDEALEGEGELSDDELHEIYASMDPSDLERHYMIVRSLLRDAYAKAEKEEVEKCGDVTKSETKTKEDRLNKSESNEVVKKLEELEKSNSELKSSLAQAVKAIKILVKPERKAVTNEVEFVKKSEEEKQIEKMSKEEIRTKLNIKVKDESLSKKDRDTINTYLLSGARDEDEKPVLEILSRK